MEPDSEKTTREPEEEHLTDVMQEEPEPPTRTIFTILIIIGVALVAGFAWYATRLNTDPEKECAYRGGTWLPAEHECIFEGGAQGDVGQVGMREQSVTLTIPEASDTTITFDGIEIGAPTTESQTFSQTGGTQGSVSLVAELGRVQKNTRDLIMPFGVNYGGSGVFFYIGVFTESERGYVLRESVLVGDRIGTQSLSLSQVDDRGAYTARLSYRDRRDGEALTDVPTEPRTFEAVVYDHQIDATYTLGRDGLYYKDVLRVSKPALRAQITSPLAITGSARGGWYFEGSFPVVLTDWDGKIIGEGVAQAQGEWMTESFVPFVATLTFTAPPPAQKQNGALILRKDNPSGLPEHDDAFEIPVTFSE